MIIINHKTRIRQKSMIIKRLEIFCIPNTCLWSLYVWTKMRFKNDKCSTQINITCLQIYYFILERIIAYDYIMHLFVLVCIYSFWWTSFWWTFICFYEQLSLLIRILFKVFRCMYQHKFWLTSNILGRHLAFLVFTIFGLFIYYYFY